MTDWTRRIRALREGLKADVGVVSDLTPLADRLPDLHGLLEDLDRQLARASDAAVITLVGATGAGKSTLLNAMVGREIATEGETRPTTTQPVIYAPQDADVSELTAGATIGGGPEPVVVRYAASDSGPWSRQVLVDAPDMNSIAAEHRAVVTELAARSDVLLVVLHRQSIVEEAAVSFVDAFARRRSLVFVLNRADDVTPETRDTLLAQIRQMAESRWDAADAPVAAISARLAKVQPHADGWPELCKTLDRLVRESAIGRVRRHNAVGTAFDIAEVVQRDAADLEADLGALPEESAAALDELARRTAEEVTARLSLRKPEMSMLLWEEAAKRWEGPGGWTLRVGGLTSIGMGAGLLLARRNPLIAAGSALGGLAADATRDAGRRSRAVSLDGLLPGPGEFDSWYAEALGPARIRAGRLAGSPENLAIPSSDRTHEAVLAAVEEAWRRLVERDLPEAAARSVLRFFRLLLDLPVYAMAGWVLYRVGEGFVREEYMGMDFLVNSLLILAAYLFAVRTVVRRGLAWRTGRLLASVIERAHAAVQRELHGCSEAVGRAVEARAAALGRIAATGDTWRRAIEGKQGKR